MKPTVPEVLPVVRALFARGRGGGSCCWHVVLDDGNSAQRFAVACAEEVRAFGCPYGNPECRQLAELLPAMSSTQRIVLAAARRGRP